MGMTDTIRAALIEAREYISDAFTPPKDWGREKAIIARIDAALAEHDHPPRDATGVDAAICAHLRDEA
jgi:hypothetical protein